MEHYEYLKQTGKDTVELAVMGVLKEYHRNGIGKSLFECAKKVICEKGYSFIQVKTVQMGKYTEYDKTNQFYIALGFSITNTQYPIYITETQRRNIMLTKDELPECPVATTVQLIGSKWKLLIMRNLLARPWRFNELKKDLDGISQKVLTDSLRSMEEDGIITRTVYAEVPPRVEYALSDVGESMRPILDAMKEWGMKYKETLE